jgi:hypothetical protein
MKNNHSVFEIRFRAVERRKMRYPSAGDYFEDACGVAHIVVVKTNNWKYQALLFVHELVEYILVKAAEISIDTIDDFDINFEREREMGIHGLHDEPGDALESPYHMQHSIATVVERMLAVILRVHWADYAQIVDTCAFGGASKTTKPAGARR